MANPISHSLTLANGHIKAAAGFGKPLPIQNFRDKSLQLVVTGAGSYDVWVSNDKDLADAKWSKITAAPITSGTTIITNEEGASDRFPHKIAFLVIDTNVHVAGDEGFFLGEDAG